MTRRPAVGARKALRLDHTLDDQSAAGRCDGGNDHDRSNHSVQPEDSVVETDRQSGVPQLPPGPDHGRSVLRMAVPDHGPQARGRLTCRPGPQAMQQPHAGGPPHLALPQIDPERALHRAAGRTAAVPIGASVQHENRPHLGLSSEEPERTVSLGTRGAAEATPVVCPVSTIDAGSVTTATRPPRPAARGGPDGVAAG